LFGKKDDGALSIVSELILTRGSYDTNLFHRYNYVANNPVNFIDPYGTVLKKFWDNFMFAYNANVNILFNSPFKWLLGGALSAISESNIVGGWSIIKAVTEYIKNARRFSGAYYPSVSFAGLSGLWFAVSPYIGGFLYRTVALGGAVSAGIVLGSLVNAVLQTFVFSDPF
jgi:hypothetical protein